MNFKKDKLRRETRMTDELGNLVRRIRKQKGLNLLDLADEKLSKSTLSRLENKQPIEEDKMKLVLNKLKIKDEEIPGLVAEMRKDEAISRYMFRSIESQIRHEVLSFSEFNEKLALVLLPGVASYLKGKRYFLKGNYQKSIKHYESTINSSEDDCCPLSNVKASSLLDLSVIAYKDNNYRQALEYLGQGIEIFNDQGSKQNVRYSLYYNKALILEQLGLIEEADIAIEPAWRDLVIIQDVMTKIKVYQLKSSIMRHYKKYEDAYAILDEAFEIANMNDLADGSYYVLVDLGKITFELNRFDYSERCLKAALLLGPKLLKAKATEAHIVLSRTYLAQNQIQKAKEQINKAIKLAKKPKDANKLIQAKILLGSIFEKESNKYDACNTYKKALKLAEDYNFDQYKPDLYNRLFDCQN
jgi:tetratricopeptide (TPR) repeat protein